jgi:hypothetical protein
MRKIVRADLKKFYCKIYFVIECPKADFDNVVEHYRHLCAFYNIEGNFDLNELTDEEIPVEHFSFALTLEKSEHNYHLSTVALRNIFLNDLEIIRQLHYINDLEFECPMLSEKMFS